MMNSKKNLLWAAIVAAASISTSAAVQADDAVDNVNEELAPATAENVDTAGPTLTVHPGTTTAEKKVEAKPVHFNLNHSHTSTIHYYHPGYYDAGVNFAACGAVGATLGYWPASSTYYSPVGTYGYSAPYPLYPTYSAVPVYQYTVPVLHYPAYPAPAYYAYPGYYWGGAYGYYPGNSWGYGYYPGYSWGWGGYYGW